MNPIVFMVVFVLAVVVIGLAIFFYWRRTYGVWAQQRKKKETTTEQSQTIKYD